MNAAEVYPISSFLKYPSASREAFVEAADNAINSFTRNKMIEKLDKGLVEMKDYHTLLCTLFHQTFNGPSTFALAGASCDSRMFEIRDYLIKHAEEEKDHWQWVLSDLNSTHYQGPDPRALFPSVDCMAYVSYAFFLAERFPIGRLGMAVVLEGIGSKFGKEYGSQLVSSLKLQPQQARFFVEHGILDVAHKDEIIEVLSRADISEYDWAKLCHTATTTGILYSRMYDSAALSR